LSGWYLLKLSFFPYPPSAATPIFSPESTGLRHKPASDPAATYLSSPMTAFFLPPRHNLSSPGDPETAVGAQSLQVPPSFSSALFVFNARPSGGIYPNRPTKNVLGSLMIELPFSSCVRQLFPSSCEADWTRFNRRRFFPWHFFCNSHTFRVYIPTPGKLSPSLFLQSVYFL